MDTLCFTPIGVVESPYQEKFGTPRQPGLIKQAQGRIRFFSPYDDPACFEGLEQVSHLWIQFVFHQTRDAGWSPRVRPPRLGGNARLGLFASRSNFRPNPIGLSVVKLDERVCESNRVSLLVSGLDMLDGSPVLDVKPYVPYVDGIAEAVHGVAPHAPEKTLEVAFSAMALSQLGQAKAGESLRRLVEEVVGFDPRPAYKKGEVGAEYGAALRGYNVRWRMVTPECAEVLEIAKIPEVTER